MAYITLDRQVVSEICSHCEQRFTVVRGSVYDEGNARGLYLSGLHACDKAPVAHLAVAVCDLTRPNLPAAAFALQAWLKGDEIQMGVVDWDQSPWKGESYLGTMLDREEALARPEIEECFHIADHIVRDVPEVTDYLGA
jgi:hypothetical protein